MQTVHVTIEFNVDVEDDTDLEEIEANYTEIVTDWRKAYMIEVIANGVS